MYLTMPNYSRKMDEYFESLFSREVSHQVRPYYQTFKRTVFKSFWGFSQINLNNPLFCITETPNTFAPMLLTIARFLRDPSTDNFSNWQELVGWYNLKCNPFALGGIVNQFVFVLSLA